MRLIDADVITDWLLQEIRARDGAFSGLLGQQAANMIGKRIDEAPTIDEDLSRWIRISPAKIYECEKCGQNVMTNDIEAYKYCHGCGRKMLWNR